MMSFRTAALFIALAVSANVAAGPAKVKRSPKPVPGEWIVMLEDGIVDEVGYILDDLVKKHKVKLTAEFEPLLKGGAFEMTESQAQAVAEDPRVEGVWEQTRIEPAATVTARSWNVDRIDTRLVNMSFILPTTSTTPNPLEDAIDTLIGQGMTVLAAAGNQNSNVSGFSPARYGPPIIIGGTKGRLATDVDARWDDGPSTNRGSNHGATVDIFAPADRVLVARWSSTTAVSDPEDNATSSRTSFATPLAAGVAARLLQLYPAEGNGQIEARLISLASTTVHGVNMTNLFGSPNRLLFIASDCKRRSG